MSDDATRTSAGTAEPTTLSADGLPPPADLAPGYELGDEIGRGGMGAVFRARDRALDRKVAVKVLLDRYDPRSGTAGRFVEEARITARLQHPGIPPVYHVGALADGRPFLAMKLIEGETLASLLAASGPDAARWLGVFEAVCHAVGYAHEKGVIHRDLKPQNVMVGRFGEVQVMDWGLAKVLTEPVAPRAPGEPAATAAASAVRPPSDGSATQAGSVLGTPAYMPPEQAAGELDKIDARADVFGLGATLCALLTGKPPFDGADAESVRLNAVRGRTEAAFARLDACGTDAELVGLCKRCLAFEPADRPATASAIAAEVGRIRAAADERARTAERDRHASEVRVAEQAKRRRVIEWAAAAVAVVLAAGIAVALWQAKVARREASDAELARGEAESERKKADAAREAAEAASRQVTAQLARTAATAADLAAKRGAWEEALRQYDAAIALGAEDPNRLKLGRVFARIALSQLGPAMAELDALAVDPGIGPLRGRALLLQADYSMLLGGEGSTPPEELARRARAAGLSPADDAYARVYEAKTVPEALDRTREALRHDPDHIQALNLTTTLAWVIGRRDDARAAHARLRFLMPGSSYASAGGVYLSAMDGDRPGMERQLNAFAVGDGKPVEPVFRLIAEAICDLQDENTLLVGLPPDRQMKVMAGLTKLTGMPELAGRSGAERPVGDMYMFRLPMFKAMGRLPVFQKLELTNPLAALALLADKNALADIFAGVSEAIPDGAILLNYSNVLKQAGRLAEAEAVLRRAVDATSFANHRKACVFSLLDAHWALALSGPPAERAAWQQKARDGVRALARYGPLPPLPARYASEMARYLGESELAVRFIDGALAAAPKDVGLQLARAEALLGVASLTRAEQTARAALPQLTDASDVSRAFGVLDSALTARAFNDWTAVALGQFLVEEGTKRFGPDDDRVSYARLNLGRSYLRNGDAAAAVPHMTAYLEAERKRAAGKPDRLAWPLRTVATELTRFGRSADALPLFREYVAAADADAKGAKELPPEQAADARRLLGRALVSTDPDAAAKLLAEAHPVLAAAYPRSETGQPVRFYVSRDDVRELVQTLIDLHAAAGRTDEAAAWRAKRPPELAPRPRPKPEK